MCVYISIYIYIYIFLFIYRALINLLLFATAVRFFVLIMCGLCADFLADYVRGVCVRVCAQVLLRARPTHLSLSSAKPRRDARYPT